MESVVNMQVRALHPIPEIAGTVQLRSMTLKWSLLAATGLLLLLSCSPQRCSCRRALLEDTLQAALLHNHVQAAGQSIALALRMSGRQAASVAAALAGAFEGGGAGQGAAAASLAGLLSRGRPESAEALAQAYARALQSVLHNSTAASEAVADGLTSGDGGVERGTLQALRGVAERDGCTSLASLLQGERAVGWRGGRGRGRQAGGGLWVLHPRPGPGRTEYTGSPDRLMHFIHTDPMGAGAREVASALGSSASMDRFDLHASASWAACAVGAGGEAVAGGGGGGADSRH